MLMTLYSPRFLLMPKGEFSSVSTLGSKELSQGTGELPPHSTEHPHPSSVAPADELIHGAPWRSRMNYREAYLLACVGTRGLRGSAGVCLLVETWGARKGRADLCLERTEEAAGCLGEP